MEATFSFETLVNSLQCVLSTQTALINRTVVRALSLVTKSTLICICVCQRHWLTDQFCTDGDVVQVMAAAWYIFTHVAGND